MLFRSGWDIPTSFQASHPDVASEIEKVVVSTNPDSLVWTCSLDGVVSCKSAYDSLSEVRNSIFGVSRFGHLLFLLLALSSFAACFMARFLRT